MCRLGCVVWDASFGMSRLGAVGGAESGSWASALSALSALSAFRKAQKFGQNSSAVAAFVAFAEVVTALLACEDGGVASSESLLVTWPKDSQEETYTG